MTSELIMNILVHFYILLELYMFAYVQELKIRYSNQYFNEVANLYCMEEISNSSDRNSQSLLPSTAKSDSPISAASISILDKAAEELLSELQTELKIEEFIKPEGDFDDFIMYDHESAYQKNSHEQQVEKEDCINLLDLEKTAEFVETGYESFASAKIADAIVGPQQWVVSIIGMEESYIHISDGKRLWINAGDKASKLRKGDVLILDVIRYEKDIVIENLFRLETDASDEYTIPDEEYQYLQPEYKNIAI